MAMETREVIDAGTGEVVATVSVEDGVLSFGLPQDAKRPVIEVLSWVSANPTMQLRGGGQKGELFYETETPVEPGDEGYFDALGDFLGGYSLIVGDVSVPVES